MGTGCIRPNLRRERLSFVYLAVLGVLLASLLSTPIHAEQPGDLCQVRGKVLTPEGKPLANAEVMLVHYWSEWRGEITPQTTTTNDNGAFELIFSPWELKRQGQGYYWREFSDVVAVAPGYGMAWKSLDTIDDLTNVELRLVPDVALQGRLLDAKGDPVQGATVSLASIESNDAEDLSLWIETLCSGTPITGIEAHNPTRYLPIRGDLLKATTRTDEEGRFTIHGVGRGRLARLEAVGGGAAFTDFEVFALPIAPITAIEKIADTKPRHFFGQSFETSLGSAQPIEGVVRDADTGAPLPGVRIVSHSFAGTNFVGTDDIWTMTDSEGHYRLEGMPRGEGNMIVAIPADGQPYLMQQFTVPSAVNAEQVHFDLPLKRGVIITGRVSDKETGRPVHGRIVYLPYPSNPHAKDLPQFKSYNLHGPEDRFITDEHGHFQVVGLPGAGIVEVVTFEGPYPTGQGIEAIGDLPSQHDFADIDYCLAPQTGWITAVGKVEISEGEEAATVNLELTKGEMVRLHIVDPAGEPLAGATIDGLWPKSRWHREGKAAADIDVLALMPAEKRLLFLFHPERGLGKALRVSPHDDVDGPVTVRLEPFGSVTGRILDAHGHPVRGARIRFDAGEGDFSAELASVTTDTHGQFTKAKIPSGWAFTISCTSPQTDYQVITREFSVQPGERVDLGTFDVTKKERPEPVRTIGRTN